eukprot:6179544-Pleurochrysis_carterae.AAC.4
MSILRKSESRLGASVAQGRHRVGRFKGSQIDFRVDAMRQRTALPHCGRRVLSDERKATGEEQPLAAFDGDVPHKRAARLRERCLKKSPLSPSSKTNLPSSRAARSRRVCLAGWLFLCAMVAILYDAQIRVTRVAWAGPHTSAEDPGAVTTSTSCNIQTMVWGGVQRVKGSNEWISEQNCRRKEYVKAERAVAQNLRGGTLWCHAEWCS